MALKCFWLKGKQDAHISLASTSSMATFNIKEVEKISGPICSKVEENQILCPTIAEC